MSETSELVSDFNDIDSFSSEVVEDVGEEVWWRSFVGRWSSTKCICAICILLAIFGNVVFLRGAVDYIVNPQSLKKGNVSGKDGQPFYLTSDIPQYYAVKSTCHKDHGCTVVIVESQYAEYTREFSNVTFLP